MRKNTILIICMIIVTIFTFNVSIRMAYVSEEGGSTGSGVTTPKPTKTPTPPKTPTPAPTCNHMHVRVVSTAASCDSSGSVTTICRDCGDVISTQSLPKLEHSWYTKTVNATCDSDGYTQQICSRCGTEGSKTPIYSLGHSWRVDSAASTPATCTTIGTKVSVCSLCGKKKSEYIEASSDGIHTDNNNDARCDMCGTSVPHVHKYEQIVDGTGTNANVLRCGCGATLNRVSRQDGGTTTTATPTPAPTPTPTSPGSPKCSHSYSWKITKNPTCTVKGTRVYKCTKCGDESMEEIIAALDHDWGVWTITSAATCTKTGVETRVCSRDSKHKETRTVAALGHIDVSPKDGKCDRCGTNMGGGTTSTPPTTITDTVPTQTTSTPGIPGVVIPAQQDGFINLSDTKGNSAYGNASYEIDVESSSGTLSATSSFGTVKISGNIIEISGIGKLSVGTKINVTIKSAENTNYKAATTTYTITITKRNLNVTITDKTKKQGEENPALEFTYRGTVNNEIPAFNGFIKTNALKDSPVGKYDIVPDGMTLKDNGDFKAANYNLKIKDGTLTITKADDKLDTETPRGNDSVEYTDQDKPVKSVIDGSDNIGIVKVVVTTEPKHGKVKVNNDRSYTYTPETGYYGDDYFISMLEDEAGNRSNPIKVTIHIRKKLEEADIMKNQVKDIVIKVNETYTTKDFPGVDKNSDRLTYEITTTPKRGTATLISGPAIQYVPAIDYVGKENFTMKVTNGKETINIKFNIRIIEEEEDKEYTWYIRGYEDGTVRPDGTITREELATIFYRIDTNSKGGKYRVKKTYSDVSKDRWSYDAIMYLSDKGILNGYEDGTFKPTKSVSRAELSAVIARYADLKSKTSMLYQDVDSSFWATDAISKVTERGLMNGYGDGSFKPNQNLTRAEVATVINRLLERNIDDAQVNDNPFSDLSASHWAYKNMVEAFTSHVVRENGNQRGKWISHSYPYLKK